MGYVKTVRIWSREGSRSEKDSHYSNYFAKTSKTFEGGTQFTYTCEHKVDIIEISNIWRV